MQLSSHPERTAVTYKDAHIYAHTRTIIYSLWNVKYVLGHLIISVFNQLSCNVEGCSLCSFCFPVTKKSIPGQLRTIGCVYSDTLSVFHDEQAVVLRSDSFDCICNAPVSPGQWMQSKNLSGFWHLLKSHLLTLLDASLFCTVLLWALLQTVILHICGEIYSYVII